MTRIPPFLLPLAERIERAAIARSVPIEITDVYTMGPAVYVYARHPNDLTPERWQRLAGAVMATLTPALCRAANYGSELQFVIFPPPEANARSASAPRDTEPSAAQRTTEQLKPWGGEQPEVRATHASPQPQQAIVDVLRPWWRIHRTEPGCITKAIRHVYGEHTPAGGMFYNRIKAAIAILDAEI